MLIRILTPALLILWTPSLFADVTIRYATDYKSGIPLPPGAGPAATLGALTGPRVIRIKGDKEYDASAGKFISITDLATNELTYIDTENMRFATDQAADFGSKLAGAMPELPAQAPNSAFKVDVQSRKTGRTEAIQGVLSTWGFCWRFHRPGQLLTC